MLWYIMKVGLVDSCGIETSAPRDRETIISSRAANSSQWHSVWFLTAESPFLLSLTPLSIDWLSSVKETGLRYDRSNGFVCHWRRPLNASSTNSWQHGIPSTQILASRWNCCCAAEKDWTVKYRILWSSNPTWRWVVVGVWCKTRDFVIL